MRPATHSQMTPVRQEPRSWPRCAPTRLACPGQQLARHQASTTPSAAAKVGAGPSLRGSGYRHCGLPGRAWRAAGEKAGLVQSPERARPRPARGAPARQGRAAGRSSAARGPARGGRASPCRGPRPPPLAAAASNTPPSSGIARVRWCGPRGLVTPRADPAPDGSAPLPEAEPGVTAWPAASWTPTAPPLGRAGVAGPVRGETDAQGRSCCAAWPRAGTCWRSTAGWPCRRRSAGRPGAPASCRLTTATTRFGWRPTPGDDVAVLEQLAARGSTTPMTWSSPRPLPEAVVVRAARRPRPGTAPAGRRRADRPARRGRCARSASARSRCGVRRSLAGRGPCTGLLHRPARGAVISSADGSWLGAQVVYPNYGHELPGAAAPLALRAGQPGWSALRHRHCQRGTRRRSCRRGHPHLRAGRRHDQQWPTRRRPAGPTPSGGEADGDPVDLGTGLFVQTQADMAVGDVLPVSVTRTYRSGDYDRRSSASA